ERAPRSRGNGRAPRPAVAARLHRFSKIEAAFERAREQGRQQGRAPAHACDLDTASAESFDESRSVTLERRHQPRREGGRSGEANGLQQPVVIQEQRVSGERKADGG